MNYRSAVYNMNSRVDCEIEHPIYGWIPYTLDPNDSDTTINNEALLETMTLAGDIAAYVAPTEEEIAYVNQQAVNNISMAYLAETDWYVSRKFETGEAIPQDILIKRQEARAVYLRKETA